MTWLRIHEIFTRPLNYWALVTSTAKLRKPYQWPLLKREHYTLEGDGRIYMPIRCRAKAVSQLEAFGPRLFMQMAEVSDNSGETATWTPRGLAESNVAKL